MKRPAILAIAALLILGQAFFPGDCSCADFGRFEWSSLRFSGISCAAGGGADILTLTVTGQKAAALEAVINPEGSCRKGMEYFFTALALPDDCFWVNLSPSSPERTIGRELEGTDFGRILLAADLRLKKDACDLTNPQTKTGREYWDRLYGKAEELGISGRIPVFNRVWIYPRPVVIAENGERMSVIDSALEVRLDKMDAVGPAQDERFAKLQAYGAGLMAESILPVLTKKVNEGAAYAGLREIYRALVIARWYKSRVHARDSFLNNVADFRQDLEQDYAYGSRDIYRDYLESMKKGEYAMTERRGNRLDTYLRMMTRRYYSGGCDLRRTEFVQGISHNGGAGETLSFSTHFSRRESRPLRAAKNYMEIQRGVADYLFRLVELLKSVPLSVTKRLEQKDGSPLNKVFLSNL